MDEAFGRYCREEWTQLQWRFEAVSVSDYSFVKVRNTLTARDVKLWEAFASTAPASDDVEEYMLRFPNAMYVNVMTWSV